MICDVCEEWSVFVRFLIVALMFMFMVKGTVSSKMWSFFFVSSTITMSGLRFVTHRSEGILPPPADSQPGRSLKTLNRILSKLVTMKSIRLLWRYVKKLLRNIPK